MKAKRFFTGYDTFGKSVEMAESESGQWFNRYWDYNGFGKGWTKWAKCKAPTFETHYRNKYTDERHEYETPQAFWGFNKMSECSEVPRVRLPS